MYGIWDDWMYGEADILALTCEIFRNGTWMDALIESGPYPNTAWVGGERWLYNPFPSGIATVIERWLPVFTYIVDLARPPNLAVSTIVTPKTIVGQGYNLNVTVVVENQGSMIEEVNVTVYIEEDALEPQSSMVESGESAFYNFTWNTTGLSKGNYTISAVVEAVPGEAVVADNILINGIVLVTIPGDVDGDRDVDIFDIVHMAGAYGTEQGNPKYAPNYDIDGDGDIDIFDLVGAAGNYGESW